MRVALRTVPDLHLQGSTLQQVVLSASPTCSLASHIMNAPHPAGREVVGQLLASPRFTQVTTVGRRPVDVPEAYKGWDAAKLKQVPRLSH